jgi:hypothetical protein
MVAFLESRGPTMPYDVDAAEDWLDRWSARVSAQAGRAATLSRRVAALTGTAESSDGSIRVTVGSSGQVAELSLADEDLARRIRAVLRRAQADLARQVAVQVDETVGADSETGRAVAHAFVSRFPGPEDPDDGR